MDDSLHDSKHTATGSHGESDLLPPLVPILQEDRQAIFAAWLKGELKELERRWRHDTRRRRRTSRPRRSR